jgi:hypothetical protein
VFARGCQKEKTNGVYAHTWPSFKQLEDAYKEIEILMRSRRKVEVKK